MSLANDLAQKNEQIAAKQAALSELFKGVTDLQGQPAHDRRDAIKSANDELTDLGKARDDLTDLVKIERSNVEAMKAMRQPSGRQILPEVEGGEDGDHPAATKSLKSYFADDTRWQDGIKSGAYRGGKVSIEVPYSAVMGTKALLTTADVTPAPQRLAPVGYASETRTIADLPLQGRMTGGSIEYYEMTTFTNAAAEATEGTGAKAEAAIDFTLRTESASTIAVWLPTTVQVLEDNDGMEQTVKDTLAFMLKQREALQLLVGDGTAPNLSGILDRSGIQTQAKGADPVPDAVFKAITKVRNTGFADPDAAIFHPNDWQDIRLLRTLDGIYIWGSPSEAGPERIWGLNVYTTTHLTENTGLVGAFRPWSQIFRRTDIQFAVSDSHSDYFIYNKLAIRAEMREAFAVYRPAAFATVTGI